MRHEPSIRYVPTAAAIDLKNRCNYYEAEPRLKDDADINDYDGGDWAELIGKGTRLYNQLNYESTNQHICSRHPRNARQ